MKTGIVFEREVDQDGIEEDDVDMLVKNFDKAMKLYKSPAEFRAIQVAAMDAAKDFSWQNSVKQYVAEFKKIGVKAV
jgi:glycogen synthase